MSLFGAISQRRGGTDLRFKLRVVDIGAHWYHNGGMVKMTIRLEDDLHKWLSESSKAQSRSIQKQIIYILKGAAVNNGKNKLSPSAKNDFDVAASQYERDGLTNHVEQTFNNISRACGISYAPGDEKKFIEKVEQLWQNQR